MGSVASALLFGVTLLWLAARLPTWVPFDPSLQETAAQGSPSHEREEAVATYEALVYKFDLTAFRDDEGSYSGDPIPYAYKLAGSASFALIGDDAERFRDAVVELVAELSLLTGLGMTVRSVDEVQPEDFLIVVLPPDLIEAMLARDDIAERFGNLGPYDGSCFALPYVEGFRITKAIVVVPNRLPDSWIRYCLLIEITQSLGLFADSDVVEPSIFSDNGSPRDELPINDKIIVRTLYDPRIAPGMPRLEALDVAREVIRELLQGVEHRGVEALYQQPSRRAPP
jgi:hypothetical protein